MNRHNLQYQPTNPFLAQSAVYRYGFNGKEVDSEGMGGGSITYDYGFRIYNASLGKFLSVDPIGAKLPYWSPYHFAGNSVIQAIDMDGLEPVKRTFQLEGVTYHFKSRIETPQAYKIRRKGALFGHRVDFKSTYDYNDDGQNDASMKLLLGSHSMAIPNKKEDLADVSKMGRFNSSDLKYLLAFLQDNPDVAFVIVGGHDVPTVEQWKTNIEDLIIRNHHRRAVEEQNSPPHLFGINISDIRVNAFQRNDDNEEAWTLERANFIKGRYFQNSASINTLSARDLNSNAFPGLKLNQWNNDPIGITILFDFRKTLERTGGDDQTSPDNQHRYGNPRFL